MTRNVDDLYRWDIKRKIKNMKNKEKAFKLI